MANSQTFLHPRPSLRQGHDISNESPFGTCTSFTLGYMDPTTGRWMGTHLWAKGWSHIGVSHDTCTDVTWPDAVLGADRVTPEGLVYNSGP